MQGLGLAVWDSAPLSHNLLSVWDVSPGVGVYGVGLGVYGLGLGVYGVEFGVYGVECGGIAWGLRFMAWGLWVVRVEEDDGEIRPWHYIYYIYVGFGVAGCRPVLTMASMTLARLALLLPNRTY